MTSSKDDNSNNSAIVNAVVATVLEISEVLWDAMCLHLFLDDPTRHQTIKTRAGHAYAKYAKYADYAHIAEYADADAD